MFIGQPSAVHTKLSILWKTVENRKKRGKEGIIFGKTLSKLLNENVWQGRGPNLNFLSMWAFSRKNQTGASQKRKIQICFNPLRVRTYI